ncbi:hypothetical protein J6590_098325, partial [Homalodisca vitripennis]
SREIIRLQSSHIHQKPSQSYGHSRLPVDFASFLYVLLYFPYTLIHRSLSAGVDFR